MLHRLVLGPQPLGQWLTEQASRRVAPRECTGEVHALPSSPVLTIIDTDSEPGSWAALIANGTLNATEHGDKDSSEMEQSQGRNGVNGSTVPLWNAARDFFYEQALGINLKVLAIESDIAACLARRKAARPDRQAAARRRG